MQAWRLGSYELVRRLGEGGMAQVYLARDVRLGREVAVKVLDQRLAERPGFRERFLREAQVAAALDHPHIVPLFDFGESNGLLYLVMPYVSGGSLQDVLRHAPLPVPDVVTYGSQMADALDYAHQRNVVHRDVKPANMLLHADGRLMLTDFGLAKILSTSRPVVPRGHPDAGTPEYMAPEQIEGLTDERSDIYALGVVLYLLLTGQLPFSGMTSSVVMEGHLYRLPPEPRRLNHAVTPAMQSVVLRALAKHSTDRFQRASDLGSALLSALVAGDAEPLPFEYTGSPLPVSLPPITPPLSRPTGMPVGGEWNTPRLQSGQFPQVHPDMLAGPTFGEPAQAQPVVHQTMHPMIQPQPKPEVDPMFGMGQRVSAGPILRSNAGPSMRPSMHSSVRSQASGVFAAPADGALGRMSAASVPLRPLPQPQPSRPLPVSQGYDASEAIAASQPIYGAASPPVPQLGVRVSRERRAERIARRRFWIVVVTVAVAIIAVCVALLIWLAQHPSGTLHVPGAQMIGQTVGTVTALCGRLRPDYIG